MGVALEGLSDDVVDAVGVVGGVGSFVGFSGLDADDGFVDVVLLFECVYFLSDGWLGCEGFGDAGSVGVGYEVGEEGAPVDDGGGGWDLFVVFEGPV